MGNTAWKDTHRHGELAGKLIHHCHLLTEDAEAHKFEHSLEVQLPFLYYLRTDVRFVPVAIGTGGYATLERLGQAIAQTLEEMKEDILVIASSDMNHYESDELTRSKDRKAINKILDLDPKGLYQVIKQNRSACAAMDQPLRCFVEPHGRDPLRLSW
jgi:AmmeMemoRadiSam system protein B